MWNSSHAYTAQQGLDSTKTLLSYYSPFGLGAMLGCAHIEIGQTSDWRLR
jgi:hypothetical protein